MNGLLQHITVGEWVAMCTFVLSGVSAIVMVTWRVNKGMSDIRSDIQRTLEEHSVYEEKKRAEMWRRIDELKIIADSKFVHKEICALLHQDTAKYVNKLEMKFDAFAEKMSDKIDNLVVKVAQFTNGKE